MKHFRVRIRNEQGGAGPQSIIVLAIFAVAIYAALQIFAVYDKHWTFEKHVKTLVQFAFVNLHGDRKQQIFDQIIDMLDDMDAQYEKKNVRVNVDEKEKTIAVEVWYAQNINVPFFPNSKRFHVKIQRTDTME
jgi:hypothetical protein